MYCDFCYFPRSLAYHTQNLTNTYIYIYICNIITQMNKKGMIMLRVSIHTPTEEKKKPKKNKGSKQGNKKDVGIPKCPFRLDRAEIVNLNDIEVEKDSTLMELRVMLHGNPMCSHAPSPYHLRLSKVDDYMQPCRILKRNDQHIKFSGLKNGTKILIQILAEEEKLNPKCTLFRIVRRNCVTHSYDTRTKPFIFDQRSICNLGALKYHVRMIFDDIPVAQMSMAWYQMHSLSWQEIKQSKRRKKKRRKKNNLLSQLAQLPDNTVMAVKDTLDDVKGIDNFRSKYDVYMRRMNRSAHDNDAAINISVDVPSLKINVS